MNQIRILFFGSTSDSVLVLEKLLALRIEAVVTQPPRPVGRDKAITPTPVELWAKKHNITTLSFASHTDKPWLFSDEQTVIDALSPIKADLIVSASYGQKIPSSTMQSARFGGVNVHPSLLPRWRGADPVPWAILVGDKQIGTTVVTLSERFDDGKIIVQKKIPVSPTDQSDPLRTKLFALGAELLVENLLDYLSGKMKGQVQDAKKSTYARKFTREDGFIPWQLIDEAVDGKPMASLEKYSNVTIVKDYMKFQPDWKKEESLGTVIERFFRGLSPWPGMWTNVAVHGQEKRLKLLKLNTRAHTLQLETVQLEGKNPVRFEEFQKAYATT